jgi:opacity protein-like surface antigen
MEPAALALYVTLAAGASWTNGTVPEDPAGSPWNPQGMIQHGYSPSGRLGAGLRYDHWDLELNAGYLGKWQVNRDSSQCECFDTSGYNLNTYNVSVLGRYNLPISERWAAFVEAGIGFVHWEAAQWTYCHCESVGGWASTSGWETAPQFGVGVSYTLSPKWELTGTLAYTAASVNTTQVLVGVRYFLK